MRAFCQTVLGDVGSEGCRRANRIANSATNVLEGPNRKLARLNVPLAQSRLLLLGSDGASEEVVGLLLLEGALGLPGGALLCEADALEGLGARVALVEAEELGNKGALDESSLRGAGDCEGEAKGKQRRESAKLGEGFMGEQRCIVGRWRARIKDEMKSKHTLNGRGSDGERQGSDSEELGEHDGRSDGARARRRRN